MQDKVGTRVIIRDDCRTGISSAVGKKGKIVGHVTILGMSSPRIELDDGDVIHGYECWWEPYKEIVGSMYS